MISFNLKNKRNKFVFFVLYGLCSFCFPQVSFEDAFPNLTFSRPVEIVPSNDGSNRLFVLEQSGIIKVFSNDIQVIEQSVSTFLNIESVVAFNAGQEIGLLGLALHPNFSNNGFVYVYYTDDPGDIRINVVRYQISENDPNQLNPQSATLILQFSKTGNLANETNHNGGKLVFGPDGYLYISVGDGGGAGDPNGNAQNLDNFFGAILRIDVDNPSDGNNYGIPNDNPRVGQNGRDELFSWGIRNTWKMSFDSESGTLYGADVGQAREEEINVIRNGGNYGWNRFEGSQVFLADNLITEPHIEPLLSYDHSNGDLSITGGYVYHGDLVDIDGKYIYGDYISGRVWALDPNGNENLNNELLFKAEGINISSFGLDEAGELYFSSYAQNGKIYKLTGNRQATQDVAVDGFGNWIYADTNGINGLVKSVFEYDDAFYVGGNFTLAGTTSVSNLAKYSKTNGWESIGDASINGQIETVVVDTNGIVYIGGDFTEIDGENIANIAKFENNSWSSLGEGTSGPVLKMLINETGDLYVGGTFITAGNAEANNIALWTNNAWNAFEDVSTNEIGTNNEVRSLAIDQNGDLYIGGNFSSAGGNQASRIAVWNGSNWSTLGLGTSGFVQDIFITGDYIYAGGNFNTAGGQEANRIARWNRISLQWESLGNGLSGNVNAISGNEGFIYVGGAFQTATNDSGPNQIVNNIARWSSDTEWQALGPQREVGVTTLVNAIAFATNGELMVGGNFSQAGATPASNIALWGTNATCENRTITTRVVHNSTTQNGITNLTILEGDRLELGITEDLSFSITSPTDSMTQGSLSIEQATSSDIGEYRITTTEGCTLVFSLNVAIGTADDDGDGISNAEDDCPNTPNGEPVDANGCSESQRDDDGDGVVNNADRCPNTPNGANVDSEGCVRLPVSTNNFRIATTDLTCPDRNNGVVSIIAQEAYDYTAELTIGDSFTATREFSENTSIEELAQGTYDLCITIAQFPNYEFCTIAVIGSPEPLSIQSQLDVPNGSLHLTLKGSDSYTITFNEQTTNMQQSTLDLVLKNGKNTLKVVTDSDCQGVFEETFHFDEATKLYPNPVKNQLWIETMGNFDLDKDLNLRIYEFSGKMIHEKTVEMDVKGKVHLSDLHFLPGMYLIKLEQYTKSITQKFVKQ